MITDHDRRLNQLRALQRLLDNAFRVPGTRFRFGWDPIVGLVPWAGDVLAAVMGCLIVTQAHRMGLPRVVQLRMLINVGLDLALGIVPFLGDVADVFWKSNARNLALLERHATGTGRAQRGDWLFVIGIAAAIAAMALLPLIVMYWFVNALGRALL